MKHFRARAGTLFCVLSLSGLASLVLLDTQQAVAATGVMAPKLDLTTEEVLIRKLELVVGDSIESVDEINTALRLADLYSEHARQIEFQSQGEIPKDLKVKTDDDRRNALRIYTSVFDKLTGDLQAKILLQRAYLHQSLREPEKAEALYTDVISHPKKYSSLLQAEAHLQRGEIQFAKPDFKKSLADYEFAYAVKGYPRRGYALYKQSWCKFNMGQESAAERDIHTLLTTASLLSASKTAGTGAPAEPDGAFQDEASHDYATFMSHRPVTAKDIQNIERLTPEASRTPNLTYLAQELDRTGQKSSALLIWNQLGTQAHQSGEDRLEGQVKITRIQYDLGKKENVVAEMKKTVEMWRKDGCDDANRCQNLQAGLKKLLKDWTAAEESDPSKELVDASEAYLSMFADPVMSFLAARTAEHAKLYPQAHRLYQQSAEWAAQLRGKIADSTGNKNNEDLLNNSLLAEISVAEASHDGLLRSSSYQHYLHFSPNGPKAFEVKYQMAQMTADQKKFKEAADQFHVLAISTDRKENAALALKAADLALDNLAQNKDDETILQWSPELAEVYPQRRVEYAKISRNAALNLAARTINDDKSSDASLRAELGRLKAIDLNGSSDEEKLKVYQHRIVISRRLRELGEVDRGAASILVLKKVSAEDKDRARETLAWSAEFQMKFKDALYWHKQIVHPQASHSQEALKRGLLAELAHENAEPYYKDYFASTAPSVTTAAIAYDLVLNSAKPQREYAIYHHQLRADAATCAQAVVWVGLKTNDEKWASRELASQKLLGTPIGSEFAQFSRGKEAWTQDLKTPDIRLSSGSDSELKHFLKKAMNSIQQLEQQIVSAQTHEQSLVTMGKLAILLRANQDLATAITRLPAPRHLNKGQKVQYRLALAQQANPYQNRATEIDRKLGDLLKNWSAATKIGATMKDPHALLAYNELKLVTAIAKKSHIAISKYGSEPENGKILGVALKSAEEDLKRNPFNAGSMARLMEIEQQLGNRAMVMEIASRVAESKEKVE